MMGVSLTGKGDASIQVDALPDPKRYKGEAPAVVLIDPQFAHNVGNAIRACSCWGINQLWWTGNSFTVAKGERLPREERMKGYKNVALFRHDRPLDCFEAGAVPVAVELRPGSEMLHHFEHPDKAVYVFGPENGSIPKAVLARCHRFVVIPTHHCLNLAAAVNVVLYDRRLKRIAAGLEKDVPMGELLKEHRGPVG
jgi:tRNA(Leu) C34 or U34 (ribose-2'-O)-methylase TrmL